MDPLQTYIEMVDHIMDGEWDEAKEHARNLLNWFDRGGGFDGTAVQHVSIMNHCEKVLHAKH